MDIEYKIEKNELRNNSQLLDSEATDGFKEQRSWGKKTRNDLNFVHIEIQVVRHI